MQLPKILALMAPALVLLSCSSAGSDGSPATTVASTVTTTATTSATATATTATPTSTTVVLTDEEQVLAVFEAYMGFEFDERANGYGPSEQRIEQYTTGALKQRALETLQARKDAEVFLVGALTSDLVSISVAADRADVVICFQDTALAYFSDGSVADDTVETPHLLGLSLRRNNARWEIEEQRAGDAEPCEF